MDRNVMQENSFIKVYWIRHAFKTLRMFFLFLVGKHHHIVSGKTARKDIKKESIVTREVTRAL